MKKVLFHSPITYTPHWEIELNLMEKYLRQNCEVVLLVCNADLPACVANPQHAFVGCFECKSRKKNGIRWIGKDRIKIKSVYYLTDAQKKEISDLGTLDINTIEDLENIEIEGSDIGKAALSSAVASLHEANIDVVKHRDLIKRFLQTAAITHFSVTNHLNEEKPDELVVFNGRFASVRPAVRAAWRLGISTCLHESAKVAGRYLLVKDDIIHSLRVWKNLLNDEFAKSELSDEEKRKLAREWFEERRRHGTQNQLLFNEKQEDQRLPENFSDATVNIGIFNSSEDEFVGLDENLNSLYESQNEGIRQILTDFKGEPKIQFYLRMHPNLIGLDNSQTRFLTSLADEFFNLNLITPESSIDTYTLIDSCDIVVTFASTVGIEAAYAQKPSILLGRALYEDLEGIIKPENHAEFVSIIKNYLETGVLPDAGDGEKGYVKYGYFMKHAGVPLEFGESTNWWRVKMKRDGRESLIKPSIASRILNKISQHLGDG